MAFIMIVLGEDVTALIVVNLDDYDPEAVAQAISELRSVSSDRIDNVLEERDWSRV
ncbi:MAG: hypothetical protein VX910_10910 [Candidatus Latescibacterota bacterium]|nr:hypothetical protein [Candidatus Latescibacterota bacterium]